MADSRREYPEEFRKELVGLARSGRSAESLGRQFEPSAQTIRNWVRAADLAEGHLESSRSEADRAESRHLRKENRRLQMELEIMAKAAAWFARETDSTSTGSSSS